MKEGKANAVMEAHSSDRVEGKRCDLGRCQQISPKQDYM